MIIENFGQLFLHSVGDIGHFFDRSANNMSKVNKKDTSVTLLRLLMYRHSKFNQISYTIQVLTLLFFFAWNTHAKPILVNILNSVELFLRYTFWLHLSTQGVEDEKEERQVAVSIPLFHIKLVYQDVAHSQYLLVQSQQWKHKNNLFCLKTFV